MSAKVKSGQNWLKNGGNSNEDLFAGKTKEKVLEKFAATCRMLKKEKSFWTEVNEAKEMMEKNTNAQYCVFDDGRIHVQYGHKEAYTQWDVSEDEMPAEAMEKMREFYYAALAAGPYDRSFGDPDVAYVPINIRTRMIRSYSAAIPVRGPQTLDVQEK